MFKMNLIIIDFHNLHYCCALTPSGKGTQKWVKIGVWSLLKRTLGAFVMMLLGILSSVSYSFAIYFYAVEHSSCGINLLTKHGHKMLECATLWKDCYKLKPSQIANKNEPIKCKCLGRLSFNDLILECVNDLVIVYSSSRIKRIKLLKVAIFSLLQDKCFFSATNFSSCKR